MKNKIRVLLLILVMVLSLGIFACKKEVEYATLTVYIDFEPVGTRSVEVGSKIDFDLGDDDYLFYGWYNADESECLDSTVVSGDMDIYAKVIKKGTKYRITYHMVDEASFGTGFYPRYYLVGEVTTLVAPKRPYNYTFNGWKLNDNYISEISDTMVGDIDLYDSWTDNNVYHNISYVAEGATSYSDELVTRFMEGEEFSLAYPIKEGYYFRGWYLENTYTTRIYGIDENVKSDLTLYAKFEEKTKANTYVSFMGDSISTYHGTIPEDAGAYYPTFLDFPVEQTYFMQVVNGMGYNFLKNNSYSGSRLTSNVYSDGIKIPNALSDNRIEGLSDGVHDPDILIVHIGTNDYSQGISAATFETCLEAFIKKVRAKYDDVEIYMCLHPYNGYGEGYVQIREDFNAVIVKLSKEDRCNYGVLDLTQAWDETNYRTYIFSNAHPSVAGFKAMADVIIATLQETHTFN